MIYWDLMDKTKIAWLFVILAIVVGITVIAFDKKQNQSATQNIEPATPQPTLAGLEKALSVTQDLQDSLYIDWVDDKNTVVPLSGKQFFLGTVDIKGKERYKDIANIDTINFDTLQAVEKPTNAYFTAKGFTKNSKNTKVYPLESSSYETIGYEKGDLKCLVRLDETTDPFGNFFCGTVDTAQIDLQKQMGALLPYKITKTGITSFRVQKIEDNYAIGTASETYTGYTWMAKKTGNAWKILWKSNDIAPCADMVRLGIPKSIYGNCYSPEG